MSMQEHYNINDVEWSKLTASGITTLDLVKAVPKFDINETGAKISKFHLMYYIDRNGDFTGKKTKNDKIAFAVFSSLDQKSKTEIIQYIPDED